MFKEKISFVEEFPVYVVTANVYDYPIHFSDDLEIFYVLKGDIKLKSGYYEHHLERGDIFVVNPRETLSISKCEHENMVMMLRLNLDYFKKYHQELDNCFFQAKNTKGDGLSELQNFMKKIMMEFLEKGNGYEHKIIETCHNLISLLMTEFQCEKLEDDCNVTATDLSKKGSVVTKRINRINNYIYDNFSRKVTLNEIADKEKLSIYYLSHIIKDATGLSFQDFLSFVRVEESKKILMKTNKKIGIISQEIGFSAVRYYIKHFKKWYGIEPQEYRKNGTEIYNYKASDMYKRSTPKEIEFALKKQNNKENRNENRTKNKPIIVEIDFTDNMKNEVDEEFKIAELIKKDSIKPMARSYTLMKSLNENIIKSGENYMIATAERDNQLTSMTLLAYNIDEDLKYKLIACRSREAVKEIIKEYDEENEFLLKCIVPKGEYKISRYKLTRENILVSYEESTRNSSLAEKRKMLINSWSTLPDVEFNNIITSESLSIRTTLKGVSSELILIDKID